MAIEPGTRGRRLAVRLCAHWGAWWAGMLIAIGSVPAAAGIITVDRMGAYSGFSGAGQTPFQQSGDRQDRRDPSGLQRSAIARIGVDSGNNTYKGDAYQNDAQISRASIEMALTEGVDSDQTLDNFVYGHSSTMTWLTVTNDTKESDRLFYEFSLSGMELRVANANMTGRNPLLDSSSGGGVKNIWEAWPEHNTDSPATAVRIDFVIYQYSKWYADPNGSFYDILDFEPFEQYGYQSQYYAAFEVHATHDGNDSVRYVTEEDNMKGKRTELCNDYLGCYGTQFDIENLNGVIDLGDFAPGQSDSLMIYSRTTIATDPFETFTLARIGDPGGLTGGTTGFLRSSNQTNPPVEVPVPATGLLVLLGLGALAISRRRGGVLTGVDDRIDPPNS